MLRRKPGTGPSAKPLPRGREIAFAVVCMAMASACVVFFLARHSWSDQAMGAAGAILFGVLATPPIARLGHVGADRRSPRWGAYLPLAAAVAEVPWVIIMLLGLLIVVGDRPFEATDAAERSFGTLAALPAAAGLVTGIIAITGRWAEGLVEWFCLLIGWLACGAIAWALASGVLG